MLKEHNATIILNHHKKPNNQWTNFSSKFSEVTMLGNLNSWTISCYVLTTSCHV